MTYNHLLSIILYIYRHRKVIPHLQCLTSEYEPSCSQVSASGFIGTCPPYQWPMFEGYARGYAPKKWPEKWYLVAPHQKILEFPST
jgi:hypothetical protein